MSEKPACFVCGGKGCEFCPKVDPPRVEVTVISAEGVFPGVLTSDEQGDLIQTSGYCEDYPCCGHEAGDCFGQKYGSDEDIKRRVYERWERGEQDDPYQDENGEWC